MRTHKKAWCVMAILTSVLASAPAGACAEDAPVPVPTDMSVQTSTPAQLAALAVSGDEAAARDAQARLRAAGPAGLLAFEGAHAVALQAAAAAIEAAADAPAGARDPAGLQEPARARLLAALDAVCGQKDCVLSRLYWHTDLDEAVRRATAERKPILSLRLLGRLDEELSCANSRFFRALLYPHPALAQALRERFVLHWSSERPAPKLSIDLGDGRSLTTTITGNSAHYVLDPAGRPVDVLPGLHAPTAFLVALTRAEQLALKTAALSGPAREKALARLHGEQLADLDRAWNDALLAAGELRLGAPQARRARVAAPRAGQAAPIAITKAAVEIPLLGQLDEPIAPDPAAARFERLADGLAPTIALARASLGLMRTQQWPSGDPTRDAADFAAAQAGLVRTLALDTLRNEYEIHREIHTWWTSGAAAPLDLAALNRRVYDELFLTPRSDPWLGLGDPTTYSGLLGAGRRAQAAG